MQVWLLIFCMWLPNARWELVPFHLLIFYYFIWFRADKCIPQLFIYCLCLHCYFGFSWCLLGFALSWHWLAGVTWGKVSSRIAFCYWQNVMIAVLDLYVIGSHVVSPHFIPLSWLRLLLVSLILLLNIHVSVQYVAIEGGWSLALTQVTPHLSPRLLSSLCCHLSNKNIKCPSQRREVTWPQHRKTVNLSETTQAGIWDY